VGVYLSRGWFPACPPVSIRCSVSEARTLAYPAVGSSFSRQAPGQSATHQLQRVPASSCLDTPGFSVSSLFLTVSLGSRRYLSGPRWLLTFLLAHVLACHFSFCRPPSPGGCPDLPVPVLFQGIPWLPGASTYLRPLTFSQYRHLGMIS